MRTRLTKRTGWAALLAAVTVLTGCVAAAAAAGAGAGIYLTSRGAESLVQGSVDDVVGRARAAFGELQIDETGYSTEEEGDEQTLVGQKGDLEVTVEMERESPTTTKTEVTAKRGTAQWDKDFAKEVMARIVGGES